MGLSFREVTLRLNLTGLELLFLVLLGVFAGSAVVVVSPWYGWHEQQRICQLLLVLVVAVSTPFLSRQALDRRVLLMLAIIFILGACSSLLADYPRWAFKEWACYAGMLLLAVLLGSVARNAGLQRIVLFLLVIVGAINAFQFLVSYLAAVLTGLYMFDPLLLYSGFDNPRFLGQFQVLLLPICAALVVQLHGEGQRWLARCLFVVLGVQWCVGFSLAGRGVLAGLIVGHLALLFFGRRHWRLVAVQVGAALFGFFLWLLLFKQVPFLLGESLNLPDNLRVGLASRDLLWASAWDMAIASPWLGVGPMHYAATYNTIAAHPHQVVLQWLAEWGWVSATLASLLCVWGVRRGVVVLRPLYASPTDAGLWVAFVGALVLAQVDGVFVMPYVETWLAVLIGLALASWVRPLPATHLQRVGSTVIALVVVLIVGRVLVIEVPNLPQVQRDYLEKHSVSLSPRFWLQGWIPME